MSVTTTRITPAAWDLIIRFETGGRDYYEKVYKSGPCWPGGSSGVTIGCGYDLGYERSFAKDWQGIFSLEDFKRLSRAIGIRGSRARAALSGVHNISTPWDSALSVFERTSLPQAIRETVNTFPEAEAALTPDAFGALVSLVFNRGISMDSSDRRTEMRAIQNLLRARDLSGWKLHVAIAKQLRLMKRLWKDDPKSDGDLVDRRQAEADLVLKGF